MPSITAGRKTAKGSKRVVVARSPQGYVPTAKEAKFASKSDEVAEATLAGEERFNITFTDLSAEDLKALEEALVSSRSSYRITKYGRADGGKAKMMPAMAARVKFARITRLLAKTRKAQSKFEKAISA